MQILQTQNHLRGLSLIALCLVVTATSISAQTRKPTRPLKLNQTIERQLSGKEVHEYVVKVKVGEFVQLRVEQKGIDLAIKLYRTNKTLLVAEMDSPNGREGFETLSWISKAAGSYSFKLNRLDEEGNAQFGNYSITLTAKNAPTEANRRRIEAEQMFLQVVRTRPANRQGIPVLLRQYENLLTIWQDLKDEQMTNLVKRAMTRLKELQANSEVEAKAESEAARKAKLVVQTNHAILIQSVAFSRDGRILATGDARGAIKLWDSESGRQLRTIEGHPRIKVGADEQPFPAKSKDWLISFFETIKGAGNTVHSLEFSPDGKTLASGSTDKTIRIWDIATGHQEKVFLQPMRVWLIAFNQDGKLMLSIGEDGSYRYWDVEREAEIKDNPPPLSSFRLPWQSPGGRLTASYSEKDKIIKLTDSATRTQELLQGHDAGVRRAVFSPDGSTLASCGWDRTIRLWDTAGQKLPKVLSGHTAFVSSLAFSLDGKRLASAGADLTVRLWDVESGKQLKTLRGYGDSVDPFAFGKDNKILLTATDNIMHVWDIEQGQKFDGTPVHTGYVNLVVFSDDKRVVATSDQSGFDIRELPRLGPILRLPRDDIGPANKNLQSDQVIRLWDVESGNRLHSFRGHTEEITALAFSADGKNLVSGSNDSTVKVWRTDNGEEIATLKGHDRWMSAVAISHDGTMVASYNSGEIKVWSVADKRELRVFHEPVDSEKLGWIGFSADAKTLIGAGNEGIVYVWNIESGRLEKTLTAKNPEENKIILRLIPNYYQKVGPNFTDDLKFTVRGNPGGKIGLYEVSSGKLLAWLIALDEAGWAVVTPDGLFDASLKARKQMHYVIGLETITLEQMKDLYYVPGLLSKIFKGETLPKVDLFSAEDLFPIAEYQQPEPDQKAFTVKLINRGGGIGHVQVLINDKECGGDARPPNFDPQQPSVTLQIDLEKCDLLIPGKQNVIEVVARNAVGSLNSRGSSRGVEIVGLFGDSSEPPPPHVYAIIGGVSDYTGDNLDLSYAAKDAEDFAKALDLGASKLFGVDKVHIRLLTSNGAKSNVTFNTVDAKTVTATKADFTTAFEEFKKAGPNDVFVVYLAGHGVSFNAGQNVTQTISDTYLYLTQEATTTHADILAVKKVRDAMSISDDELAELMKRNRALKQVLILDTCAAGAAVTSLIRRRDLPADQIKAIDRLQDRIGFFVLMGSAADRVSYETSQYGQGLLTYSLLKAMKGASLRDEKFADINLLFTYAQETVPTLAENIGGIQRPIVMTPERPGIFGERGSFDIGMFTADEMKEIKLAISKPFILRPTLIDIDENYDKMELTSLLRGVLREAEASLAFVDADEMIDAVRLSGSYTTRGNTVLVTLRLTRNNVPLGKSLTIEGKLEDKEQLIKKIVAALVKTDFTN